MRKLTLIALLAIAASTPAFGFSHAVTKRGDLDADGTDETVRSARVDLPDVATEFDPTQVRVGDTCGATPIDRRIAGPQDYLVTLKLRAIDTRPGLEVFVDMRSGASARQGETRVVAWRVHSGTPCRRARDLFKYKSTHPTHRPPARRERSRASRSRPPSGQLAIPAARWSSPRSSSGGASRSAAAP